MDKWKNLRWIIFIWSLILNYRSVLIIAVDNSITSSLIILFYTISFYFSSLWVGISYFRNPHVFSFLTSFASAWAELLLLCVYKILVRILIRLILKYPWMFSPTPISSDTMVNCPTFRWCFKWIYLVTLGIYIYIVYQTAFLTGYLISL